MGLKGRSPELTGGGLIRSSGGWREVKEAYRDGIRLSSDERILGSSDFVEKTLKEVSEDFDRRLRLPSAGIDLSSLIDAVCRYLAIDQKERLVDMTRKPRKKMPWPSCLRLHLPRY